MANKTVVVKGKKSHTRRIKKKCGYKTVQVKSSNTYAYRKRSK